MPKILIACLTCQSYKDNGNVQAVRDTWWEEAKRLGFDCKFFMGQGSTITQSDEVLLDAPDDYANVTYKTKELYRYAMEKGYDYIFKCYADTYVCPSRLLKSGFEKYDYSGNYACKPLTGEYCCGGTGVWLSKAVFSLLVDANIYIADTTFTIGRPLRTKGRAPIRMLCKEYPKTFVIKNIISWAEDKWSGDVVRATKKFTTHHDTRYEDNVMTAGPEMGNQKITIHLSRPVAEGVPSHYENQWLYAKHNAWLSGAKTLPKVAVITPTLPSRRTLLEECRASVKAQDYNGEILHVVREDTQGVGPAAMRNSIVRNLDHSYEWLAFVDDDDKLLPNHLFTLMDNSQDSDVVYANSREEGFIKTWKTREFDYDSIQAENYIPVTVLMRRSVFDKIGGFDLKHFPGEDQWMFLNAASAGARFRYVPQVTWIYRKSPQHRCLST